METCGSQTQGARGDSGVGGEVCPQKDIRQLEPFWLMTARSGGWLLRVCPWRVRGCSSTPCSSVESVPATKKYRAQAVLRFRDADTDTDFRHFSMTMSTYTFGASLVAQWSRIHLPMQETRVGSLGWEDSPGEGDDSPLQYSCLGNPIDRGAWWAKTLDTT